VLGTGGVAAVTCGDHCCFGVTADVLMTSL
jgi:hypothetical protein